MKKAKKKIALPRREWQINPSARVNDPAKTRPRPGPQQYLRRSQNEE